MLPWFILLAWPAAAEPTPPAVLPEPGSVVAEDQAFVVSLSTDAPPACSFRVDGSSDPVAAAAVPEPRRSELLAAAGVSASTGAWVLEGAGRFPPGRFVTLECAPPPDSSWTPAAFRVRPEFTASVDCGRDCPPLEDLALRFSARVSGDAAARLVLEAAGPSKGRPPRRWQARLDGSGPEVGSVAFAGPFPPSTSLRVVFPKGFTDDSGRKLARATTELRTAPYPSLAAFPAPFVVLEARAEPSLPATVWNSRGVTARVARVKVLAAFGQPRLAAALDKLEAAGRADAEGFFSGLETPRETPLPRPNGVSALELVGIPLPGLGLYAAELRESGSGSKSRAVALVTNLAVHLKRGARSSLIWVTSLDRGEPVGSASVALADRAGRVLWQGATDKAGLARAAHEELPAGLAAAAWKGGDFSLALDAWSAGGERRASMPPERPVEPASVAETSPADGPLAFAKLAVSSAPLIGAATAAIEAAWLSRGVATAQGVVEVSLATAAFPASPGFQASAFANGPFGLGLSSPQASYRFELPASTEAALSSSFPLSALELPHRLDASLEVAASTETPPARLEVSARVLPSARLVGLGLGRSRSLTVSVAGPEGSPAAGAPFKVELLLPEPPKKRRLPGGFYAPPEPSSAPARLLVCAGVTGRRGRSSCRAPAGEGVLEAVTEDDEGRASYAHLPLPPRPVARDIVPGNVLREDEEELELELEPRTFSPGETAVLELSSPWPDSYALVTVERGEVLDAFVQRVSPRRPRVRVPVRDRHAPAAIVSVLTVRGRQPGAKRSIASDAARPRARHGSAELRVSGPAGAERPEAAVTASLMGKVLGRRRFGRLDPALHDD